MKSILTPRRLAKRKKNLTSFRHYLLHYTTLLTDHHVGANVTFKFDSKDNIVYSGGVHFLSYDD